ncbi:hypothetical protein ACQ4M3_09920 [Leptolyngbya sp. AN03gr2]|uniref:hypothetical protein n=1 Tax=unclassified Leptolyngbya TaxID=2650499 RepID=UPI003D31DA13
MDRQQRELRARAAKDFAESLNKLQQTLCTPEAEPAELEEPSLDIEQAFADLERFMQEQDEQN